MSMSRKIAAAVDELIRSCAAPSDVTAESGPDRLTLSVSLATPVGVACDGLEFATTRAPDGGAPWSTGALRAWGDRLAARVTYLMEPLVLHEIDGQDGAVIYRSAAPTHRDGRRSYYEARLDGRGTLRLHRWIYDDATRRREPAPCQFTREVLERLADDLVASTLR